MNKIIGFAASDCEIVTCYKKAVGIGRVAVTDTVIKNSGILRIKRFTRLFPIFLLCVIVFSSCSSHTSVVPDVDTVETQRVDEENILSVLNSFWFSDLIDSVNGNETYEEWDDSAIVPPSVMLPSLQEYELPKFLTDYAFVYDITNQEYLFISNHDCQVYPASTIKLLTVMYAQTLLPLDLEVRPGDELSMVGKNSSLALINSNHVLTVEQLIKGMLLASGNDAAHTLAAAGGRMLDPGVKNGKEAVKVFMKGMNEYAKELGIKGSNFMTPDGYQVEGNYSTVEDMAIVARLAYQDPIIRSICTIQKEKVVFVSGHHITWKNTNMGVRQDSIYYNKYINGLKTGMASDDYYCNIASCSISGREFVFGFFGETTLSNRYKDVHNAVEWVMENFID